jgi:hypothetical protein
MVYYMIYINTQVLIKIKTLVYKQDDMTVFTQYDLFIGEYKHVYSFY